MTETRTIEITIHEAQMLQTDMDAHIKLKGMAVPAPQGIPQSYSLTMREDFHNRLTAAFTAKPEVKVVPKKSKPKAKTVTPKTNGATEHANG